MEDGEHRQADDGQEAVAQDAGHTAVGHGQGAHEAQEDEHPNAAGGTDAIHEAKVDFSRLDGSDSNIIFVTSCFWCFTS